MLRHKKEAAPSLVPSSHPVWRCKPICAVFPPCPSLVCPVLPPFSHNPVASAPVGISLCACSSAQCAGTTVHGRLHISSPGHPPPSPFRGFLPKTKNMSGDFLQGKNTAVLWVVASVSLQGFSSSEGRGAQWKAHGHCAPGQPGLAQLRAHTNTCTHRASGSEHQHYRGEPSTESPGIPQIA